MKQESSRESVREISQGSHAIVEAPIAVGAGGQTTPSVRKVATTVYITEEQQARLKELNRRTRVPVAEYIREGIDLVLEKNRDELPGQMSFESAALK